MKELRLIESKRCVHDNPDKYMGPGPPVFEEMTEGTISRWGTVWSS